MELTLRLVHALWVFGLIFVDYMIQLGLSRLLETWETDPETGRDRVRVPDWLHRRRKRLDLRNAKRLLAATLKLRGVYIKLGQVLSIMGGFLPRVYAKELQVLQDAVPPHPFSAVEQVFRRSLGRDPDELFEKIEREPIAAASLGQVHEAWLEGGRKVAVKILYPGIRSVIKVDMRVLRLAMVVYKWFVPVEGIESVHSSLVDLLRRETDYLHEAACMERVKKNHAGDKDILVPDVIHELTTKDVLTMTFMEGLKINKVEQMRELGIDPNAVARRLVESFYKQVFVDRFFHADPHPGNFLVQAGPKPTRPKLVILDYGAISEVKQEMVDGMVEILQGFFDQNEKQVLEGFFRMGFASREANRELLEKTVMSYFKKLLRIKDRTPGALMRASQKDLEKLANPEVEREELRELMRSVRYPEGWFYVERASVLMFWLTGTIDPEIDPVQIGFPYVLPLVMEQRAKRGAKKGPPGTPTDEGNLLNGLLF